MTIRLGTDIVYIPRIHALINRFGKRFLQRVYTSIEQQNCGCWHTPEGLNSTECEMTRMAIAKFAGRWAAKEAVVKALGTGWQGINYTDVEICRSATGAPFVVLHNNAAKIVATWENDQETQRSGNTEDFSLSFPPSPLSPSSCEWQLSLSHDRDYAIATAIFVSR
ncbi:acyl-carrier protein synthase [Calothrix sp. NIES-4101]|nr:acyl-carrier protein synthase [Calothrix sp. NIES-4101]